MERVWRTLALSAPTTSEAPKTGPHVKMPKEARTLNAKLLNREILNPKPKTKIQIEALVPLTPKP